jgi:hypothetical protein
MENKKTTGKQIFIIRQGFTVIHHKQKYKNCLKFNKIPVEKWRKTDFQVENPGPDYYSFIRKEKQSLWISGLPGAAPVWVP